MDFSSKPARCRIPAAHRPLRLHDRRESRSALLGSFSLSQKLAHVLHVLIAVEGRVRLTGDAIRVDAPPVNASRCRSRPFCWSSKWSSHRYANIHKATGVGPRFGSIHTGGDACPLPMTHDRDLDGNARPPPRITVA